MSKRLSTSNEFARLTHLIRTREKKERYTAFTFAVLALLSFATLGSTVRANTYIYPDKGQSTEQQNQDKWECHQWAVQQTGVDPEKIAQEATSRDAYKQPDGGYYAGAGLKGGVVGGALGALGGAIAGVPGEGALIGAAVAGVANVVRARHKINEQNDYNQAVAKQHQAQLNQYDRAYATCLKGRGYTVG
ncbi:MAG: hypothetical protein O6944_08405 [Gammaproteobacteria bacterium]|nr:hypothetical protein [Gammaproteobacteria bacterium]